MRSLVVAFLALASAGALQPREAAAQSFLEKLFGFGAGAAGPAIGAPRQVILPGPYRSPSAVTRTTASEQPDEAGERRAYRTGELRAVCVRLCDGYFWPLNDHASAQTLKVEAERCEAACGTEARLFYQDRDQPDPAAMTDLSGQRYEKLETAFLYRKRLISGCGCKPAPWSLAERERHRGYAIAEALIAEANAARLAAAGAGVPLPIRRPAEASVAEPTSADPPARLAANETPSAAESAPQDAAERGARIGIAAAESAPQDAVDDAAAILAGRAEPVRRPPTAAANAGQVRTQRVADGGRTKAARVTVSRLRPQRLASTQPAAGFGFGKPKYVWPGDR